MKKPLLCLRQSFILATAVVVSVVTTESEAQTIDLGWTAADQPDGVLATWVPSVNMTASAATQFAGGVGGTVQSGISNFAPVTKWVNSPGYDLSTTSWQTALGNAATQENASWELVFRPGDFTGTHTLFNSGGNGAGIGFTITGSIVDFRIQNAANDAQRVFVEADLSAIGAATDFYYVVGVVDVDSAIEGTASLYVNGALVAGPTTSTGTLEDWDGGNLAELGKGTNIPGGNPFPATAFTGDIAEFNYYGGELVDAAFVTTRYQEYAGAEIDDLTLDSVINFPTPTDPVVLSSAAGGAVVGNLIGLTDGGFPIATTTFELVAGVGDTDNALYAVDGNELQVAGDLSAFDDAVHSVRVEGTVDGSVVEQVVTFTVKVDSDNDQLIDDWEMMFGLLGDFATGVDHDGDSLNDDEEFVLGFDPDDEDMDDDGSNDGAEVVNGTDPRDDDSDDDMLLDGVETNTGVFVNAGDTGTDPLNPDSDDDGLLDSVEDNGGVFETANKTGTDPNDRDSDGDFSPDGTEVTAGTDPNVPGDPLQNISLGLVNYWSFDEESLEDVAHSQSLGDSTVADDGVFAGANGTDGIDFSDGLFDGGIVLDGAVAQNNGFVEIARSDDTLFGANATNSAAPNTLTMSIWVNATGFDNGWQAMMAHGEGLQYRIARRNSTNFVAHAGGIGEGPEGTQTITANSGWHHVAAVSDGAAGETRLYVDGVLDSSNGAPVIDDARTGGSLNLNIGANPDTGANNREWLGELDDAAQWNRALSEAEIAGIHNAGVNGSSLTQLLGGGGNKFQISNITYNNQGTADRSDDTISLTWPSVEGESFSIFYNTDLDDWDSDLDDGYPAEVGDSTTFSFLATRLGDPVPARAFLQVRKE